MVCKNCGVKNPDGVAACRVCGSTEWIEEKVTAPVAEPETKTCPKCGKELAVKAKFCNGCGAKQEEEPVAVVEEVPAPVVEEESAPVVEEVAPIVAEPDTKTCPKCGKELAVKAKFCNGCGEKQEDEPVAVVEEVPAPVAKEPAPVVEEAPVAEPETKTCPKCGKELAVKAKFCNGCGAKQEEEAVAVVEEVPAPVVEEPAPVVEEVPVAEPETKTCPKCGKELALKAKFCNGCGAKQEEEPVVVVEEAPAPVVEEEPAPVVEEVAPIVAEPDTKTCPKCGKELAVKAKFCNGCGAKQEEEPVVVVEEVPAPVVEEPAPVVEEAPVAEPETKTCPKCGKELAVKAKFCNGCGAKQEEEPVVVVEEVPAPVAEEPAPVVEESPVAEPETKTCPKCGKVLPKRVKFCTGCGAKQEDVAPTTKPCSCCGKILPLEAKFCLDCGMKQ